MSIFKSALLYSTGLALALGLTPLGGPAMAQTAGHVAGDGALEEVVVTARKRQENLQTTPVAVSALTADAIERTRLTRIDDLQKSVQNGCACHAVDVVVTVDVDEFATFFRAEDLVLGDFVVWQERGITQIVQARVEELVRRFRIQPSSADQERRHQRSHPKLFLKSFLHLWLSRRHGPWLFDQGWHV